MEESLVEYLAGLLDADGSLSFSFKHDQNREGRYFIGLALRLTASDAVDQNGFVESLPEITGMGTTSRYGRKQQFVVWNVSKLSDLERLIPRLTKHMVVKAKHWQRLIPFAPVAHDVVCLHRSELSRQGHNFAAISRACPPKR